MNVTRALRLIAVATALALTSGVSEAKQERITTTSTGRSFATRANETEIPRFAEICPGLARGGEPNEADLKYLHDKGYKTIVSFLDNQAESVSVVNEGMKYVNIPMHSNMFSAQPPTDSQVRQFLSIVKDSTQFPVFIHCHAGKDRTGAMSAIYRMEVCGWTKDEAIEEMKAFGFAGHFKRLYNYVRDYSPHPTLAPTTAAEATLPADAKLPADTRTP